MPKESFDQVLVFTHARLQNQSKQPIFLHQIMANIMLDDGLHSSYATSTIRLRPHLSRRTRHLAQWRTSPLSPELTIEPGETKEGTFVCAFRMSKDEWDARKSLDFTFGFQYLPNLTLRRRVRLLSARRSRCALRRGQVARRSGSLSSIVFTTISIQAGIFPAVELQGLVHVPVLLLILLVVGIIPQA